MPGPHILITTDGDTVYAIDDRMAISGDEATGAGRVIADGDDTGAVVQAVFDSIEPREESAGKPPAAPPARHIHFARGQFPWRSQVDTNGTNAVRITGNWWGTSLVAKGSIESFLDFTPTQYPLGTSAGPQISYLKVHAEGNADHFVTLSAYSDHSAIHDIQCFQTNVSMLYGQADAQRDDHRFMDTSMFYNLKSLFGGPLAIFEDGPSGIPAGLRFRHCYCNRPGAGEYGLVFRNPQRITVKDFFTGIRSGGGGGGILIENPESRFPKGPDCQQCLLQKVEVESPEDPTATAVHIRSPESATNLNQNHRIIFPRAAHGIQAVKLESADPGGVRDVKVDGLQYAPSRPDEIELINTQDCAVNFTYGPADPRSAVKIEGGKRNTVNGFGVSAGHPAGTDEWRERPREGALVWDTTNDHLFAYCYSGWRQLTGGEDTVTPQNAGVEGYQLPRETVAVDGDLSDVKDRSGIDLGEQGELVSVSDGQPSVSGTAWPAWDSDRFYFAAAIEDDAHHQPHTGNEVWKGDSVQLAMAPGHPGSSLVFTQVTAALTSEGSTIVAVDETGEPIPIDGTDVAIQRDSSVTAYEFAIPWSAVPVSPTDERFGLSFLVNDNDGDGRLGWREWGSGIGKGKDPSQFQLVEFGE